MGRRYTGQQIETVQAGGDYDEWFKIRTSLTIDDVAKLSGIDDTIAKANELGGLLLVEWSLPMPVSLAEFKTLPYDMVLPVLRAAGNFLAKRSATQPSPTTSSSDSGQSLTSSSVLIVQTTP